MNKNQKLICTVAALVALIYFALYYSGNFNVAAFLQGFGENLAAFIIVAVATIIIIERRHRK